jgi:hypothetical protein
MNVFGKIVRTSIVYENDTVEEARNIRNYMSNDDNYECISHIFTVDRSDEH